MGREGHRTALLSLLLCAFTFQTQQASARFCASLKTAGPPDYCGRSWGGVLALR